MTHARNRWLAWLLVPALLFRSLVPAGFMPVISSGGDLGIGLCPAAGSIPLHARSLPVAAHVHGAHAAQHADVHTSPAHPGGARDAHPCLFSLLAGGAVLPGVTAAWLPPGAPPVVPRPSETPRASAPGIDRAQSPRAPPQAA